MRRRPAGMEKAMSNYPDEETRAWQDQPADAAGSWPAENPDFEQDAGAAWDDDAYGEPEPGPAPDGAQAAAAQTRTRLCRSAERILLFCRESSSETKNPAGPTGF